MENGKLKVLTSHQGYQFLRRGKIWVAGRTVMELGTYPTVANSSPFWKQLSAR
jgi:hypothetical protein